MKHDDRYDTYSKLLIYIKYVAYNKHYALLCIKTVSFPGYYNLLTRLCNLVNCLQYFILTKAS